MSTITNPFQTIEKQIVNLYPQTEQELEQLYAYFGLPAGAPYNFDYNLITFDAWRHWYIFNEGVINLLPETEEELKAVYRYFKYAYEGVDYLYSYHCEPLLYRAHRRYLRRSRIAVLLES